MRVSEFLTAQGLSFESILHPPAFTAQRRAKYLGLPGKSVAKSVLLAGPDGYFVAVLPATHQVDTEALDPHLGGPVRLADEHEIAKVFHDC
ncbi:MAG: YbaK/EbsC family protein, partial [Gemmataceae bacterium]|nr:YbaK/EbsC family protein [Gemmataceae bacterium]